MLVLQTVSFSPKNGEKVPCNTKHLVMFLLISSAVIKGKATVETPANFSTSHWINNLFLLLQKYFTNRLPSASVYAILASAQTCLHWLPTNFNLPPPPQPPPPLLPPWSICTVCGHPHNCTSEWIVIKSLTVTLVPCQLIRVPICVPTAQACNSDSTHTTDCQWSLYWSHHVPVLIA